MRSSKELLAKGAAAALCAGALCMGAVVLTGCTSNGGGGSADPSASSQVATADARVFTDSLGREVELPVQLDRICPSGHTAQQVLLTMAPDKMVGLSQALTDDQLAIFGDKFKDRPVFGAVLGANDDFKREAVAAAEPQVIIYTGDVK